MSQLSWDINKAASAEEPSKKKTSSRKVLSVSQLNRQVKDVLETGFPRFWLKGEISNFTAHSSGHWYFSLKDAKSSISGVMFRGSNSRLKFRPKAGDEVVVFGRISVYEPRGNYQVYVEHMEPAGAGALQAEFEKLKAKLAGEGLFAPERKKPLPPFPKHIALVTSPTGAAVRDILNVLRRRFPFAKVSLIPTKVQGAEAAADILKALQNLSRLPHVDVAIVGRGGGSIEDLWCFNDEKVVRKIASLDLPVVSGVGHEIDFTLTDFVADLRAPTPSAAAEQVVKNIDAVLENTEQLFRRLRWSMEGYLKEARSHVRQFRLRLIDPRHSLEMLSQRCDELTFRLQQAVRKKIQSDRMYVVNLKNKLVSPQYLLETQKEKWSQSIKRLTKAMQVSLQQSKSRLQGQMNLLDSLSPLKVVDRGYALVRQEDRSY